MAAPRYINLVAGVLTQVAASETTTGGEAIVSTGASGQLDISLMPTGIGPDTSSVLASAALTSGQLVNVYNNASVATVRPADGSTTGKEANGYVLANVLSAAMATVYHSGLNTAVTGLTPGKQWLSDSTPGSVVPTSPSTAGHISQQVGVAVSATALQFAPQLAITLA
jgi:hypothetical protein